MLLRPCLRPLLSWPWKRSIPLSTRKYTTKKPKNWWDNRQKDRTGGGHHKDKPTVKQNEERVRLSRTISYLLRHGAKDVGLAIRSDGFVQVQDLLKTPNLRGLDFMQLEKIVKMDAKQRFSLSYEAMASDSSGLACWWIRANQGHSIQSINNLELKRIISPEEVPMVVHGTSPKAWKLISTQGISKMNRNHIHFATGLAKKGVISGMRSSARLLIYIDFVKAMADDLKFYLSANGVVLSPGDESGFIKPKYFRRVEILRKGYQPIPGWEGPREEGEEGVKRFVQDTAEMERLVEATATVNTEEVILPATGDVDHVDSSEDSQEREVKLKAQDKIAILE